VNTAHYNRLIIDEFDRVRDFIILHYCATERTDSPLWQYCANMSIPDSLSERIELYGRTGRIAPQGRELFSDLSWFFVLDGMGVTPRDYNPLVDSADFAQVVALMKEIHGKNAAEVSRAPSHDSFFAAAARKAAR
jgi:tryptophan halogenase